LEVIEEEYGISPGSNEFFAKQIENFFSVTIDRFKQEQANLIRTHKEQIVNLRQQLNEKDEEISKYARKSELTHVKLLKTVKEGMHLYYQQRESQMVEKLQREISDLYKEIEIMHYQRSN
jgi:predicted RNase H-like nuclease (RuvC/YqgF family)